jgi:hypothetical protein
MDGAGERVGVMDGAGEMVVELCVGDIVMVGAGDVVGVDGAAVVADLVGDTVGATVRFPPLSPL